MDQLYAYTQIYFDDWKYLFLTNVSSYDCLYAQPTTFDYAVGKSLRVVY